MALITCPECRSEVSDKAASCPKCGYPIKIEKNPTVSDLENLNNSNDRTRTKKKGIIIISCIVAVLLVIVALYLMKARTLDRTNSFFDTYAVNSDSDIIIRHEMSMREINELIGPGESMFDSETAPIQYENGLSIVYSGDYPMLISIHKVGWETEKGIHVGSSLDDIYEAYGDPCTFEEVESEFGDYYALSYNLDENGEIERNATGISRDITFHVKIENNMVYSITLFD